MGRFAGEGATEEVEAFNSGDTEGGGYLLALVAGLGSLCSSVSSVLNSLVFFLPDDFAPLFFSSAFFLSSLATASASHAAFNFPRPADGRLLHSADPAS